MSELAKIIENITNAEDFPKVLRDVAIALKSKGFFDNSNWCDDLIKHFKDVIDVKIDDSITGITDNEHEIPSSFIVGESSKFNKKSKTSTDNRTKCRSIDDMFDDSNDSFEIPETQPFPPTVNHPDNDELDSEGFITMPDDGFVANDCSQSQALLQGTELGEQSPHPTDFDDSDTVDMEKLQWDDSAKQNNDRSKSASVTPDLDFNLMTKAATIEKTDRGFDTGEMEFETTLAKSVFDALDSPHSSVLSKVPSSLGRKESKKSSIRESDKSSTDVKRVDNEELEIEKIEPDKREASTSVKYVKDEELQIEKNHRDDKLQLGDDAHSCKDDKAAKSDEAAKYDPPVENVQAVQVAEDAPAEKDKGTVEQTTNHESNKPVENSNECDDEMPETQFFFKSGDDNIENRAHVDVAEEQLFKKPVGLVAGEITKSKRVSDAISGEDADDVNEILEETQLFFKPNASSTEENDAYDAETQAFEVLEGNPSNKNPTSLVEDGPDGDGINNHVHVINVDVANDEIPEESDEPRPKLRKRNRLIESSDEEEDGATDKIDCEAPTQRFESRKGDKKVGVANSVVPDAHPERVETRKSDEEDDTADYEAHTQRFEIRKPESPRRKRISELKGGDWEQFCGAANNNQADVVFQSVFDQCKDLRKVHANNVPVASVATNQNVVAEVPIRQSARSRAKVKYGESNDADPITSKRQKLRTEPTTFKVPLDFISTKSDNAPPAEVNVSKDSSKTVVASKKSDTVLPTEVKASRNSSKALLASTKSDNVPPSENKASKNSSKAPMASSKQDETDENDALEMQHTQVFVKASSTPKERTKPDPPRRQARASTMGQKQLKDVQQPIPKLRAVRQSVTYSPTLAVKASADVNENVDDNVVDDVKLKESLLVVPRQTRKRKATDSNDSGLSSSTRSPSPSLNRSSRNQNYPVLFTMIDPAPHRTTLKKLNISITADTGNYNALVTDKVYRTSKFLCAVAAGKPIVSIEWLNALKTKKAMIDPFEFLLKDAEGEKKYQFDLAKTLQKVRQNGELYRNHSILVTPNTTPSPDILKDVIVSSGAKYLKTSLSARKNDIVLCISAEKDKTLVTQLSKKYPNLKEITAEQFMQAIFQYKI